MADRDLKDAFVGTVVDGQADRDFGDFDIAHRTGAGDIEDRVIERHILFGKFDGVIALADGIVKALGLGPQPVIILLGHEGDGLGIACDGARLVEGVPVVADGGIEHDGRARD